MKITVRPETPADVDAISRIIVAAFQNAAHSSHTEQFIVNALRRDNRLTISLVAVRAGDDSIVGHVAISPVTISSGAAGWYGLGPIAVSPDCQRQGIGATLMQAALAKLESIGGIGCVVLGDPRYYGRFGFEAYPGLALPGVPRDHFLVCPFGAEVPIGTVSYHVAFDATA